MKPDRAGTNGMNDGPEDVEQESGKIEGLEAVRDGEEYEAGESGEVVRDAEDEAELERKVEILERMRGRRGEFVAPCVEGDAADDSRTRATHRSAIPCKLNRRETTGISS
jgi:hypothetical protein